MRKLAGMMLLVAVPSALNAMPLSEFLPKAEALQKKGAMALFSSDMGLLKNELKAAGAQLRAERLSAAQAGRKPAYCPPPKGGLNPNELVTYLQTIPPAQRGMSFKDAYKSFLIKKYPCPV